MHKQPTITKEEVAEVFSRCWYTAGVDPDRVYVRDVMVLAATEEEEEETQFQATVKGYTDWYQLGFDADGKPDPKTITKLPF